MDKHSLLPPYTLAERLREWCMDMKALEFIPIKSSAATGSDAPGNYAGQMEGIAARPLCWQRGLTGGTEALPRVHSHTDESPERGWAGLVARARATSQRGASVPRRPRGP